MSYPERLALIEKDNQEINLSRQAQLLKISRSSLYYQKKINWQDIRIMNVIDQIFTRCPFYGHRRIKWALKNEYNLKIGKKKTISLMKKMGIIAIYPHKNPKTSNPDKQNSKYPYLLKDLKINHPNQVWGADITYLRLKKGFAYLTAILDWYSRYVLSWKISLDLKSDFCEESLKEALIINLPKIHNSDQGSQFTSKNYLDILRESKVKISMDGKGRCMDNIFTERLWRTVKQENIYLQNYEDIEEAKEGLEEYFDFYNNHRPHQSLSYNVPSQIYHFK